MLTEPEYEFDDVDGLIADREKFEDFVYTPIETAIYEIERRRKNASLSVKISSFLNNDIPNELTKSGIRAVMFRQITTPNYEIRRFLQIIQALDEFVPFFGEYRDDKFTSVNDQKHSWCKILFHRNHNGHFDSLTIVDLIKNDGKKLSEIKTIWGQQLIDFHHELFRTDNIQVNPDYFCDISPWLKHHGVSAKNYYEQIMFWFVQNAILFENFMPGKTKESLFTKNIFLPAFISVYQKTGLKPLIVNLVPTSIENEKFWLSHPLETKDYIESKISSNSLYGM